MVFLANGGDDVIANYLCGQMKWKKDRYFLLNMCQVGATGSASNWTK